MAKLKARRRAAVNGPEPSAEERRPLPTRLDQITRYELGDWSLYGPLIVAEGDTLRIARWEGLIVRWPDWPTFFAFYVRVREEWIATRRGRASVVEYLYQVWKRGEDVTAARDATRANLQRVLYAQVFGIEWS